MSGGRSPPLVPCPILGNAKERYICTTSPSTAHGNPRKSLCRAACYCRHSNFETAFDDTNDVPAPLLRLSCACSCLSFVVSCRRNCAITQNGSSMSIDADQPSITCDRRYESEVVAMRLSTPRSRSWLSVSTSEFHQSLRVPTRTMSATYQRH